MHKIAFLLLLIGGCGYALTKGGAAERIGGAAMFAAALLTVASFQPVVTRFTQPEVGVLAVDALLLGVLLLVALGSRRFWPLWVTGLQLVPVITHSLYFVAPDILPIAYAVAIAFWGYPMVVILAVSTWRHRQRLKQFGTDPSWTARPR